MNGIDQKVLEQTTTISFKNNEFDIQIYFVDLDGTLLDRKLTKRVSKKNVQAIKKKNEFFPVVISTGRSYSKKVSKLMKTLNIKYAICQNGSIIVDNEGNILLDIQLKSSQLNQILNIVKKHHLYFTINSKSTIFATSKWYWFFKIFLWHKIQKAKTTSYFENVNKVVVVGTLNRKKIIKVAQEIKKSTHDVSVKISGNDYVIEVTDKTATKGTGAAFISNLLKVDPKNTVHIGDSQNDATTLNVVGALIAMKNASPKLLNVATHIGPNNSRSGLAKVLNGEFKEINRD